MVDAIRVEGLTKVYGELVAVDQVGFAVRAGELFGLLGPNGAGKTTTIRMLTGLTRPTSGSAMVAGQDVVKRPFQVKEHIGMLSDVASLYNEMNVWDNLTFVARLHGLHRNKRSERIGDLLDLFGLIDSKRQPVGTLSTGQKKRLMIAAALVHEPEVLFLDEPTTGLDVQSARDLRSLMLELHSRGVTIVLTTHYIQEAEQLCQRVAIINQGRIVTIDTPDHLKSLVQQECFVQIAFDRPADELRARLQSLDQVERVIISGSGARLYVKDISEIVEPLIQAVTASGARVVSFNTNQPTLEDAFVTLTGLHPEVMLADKAPDG